MLARRPGRHHVDRRLPVGPVEGAAHRLAVDGDHPLDVPCQARRPGDEAVPERLRVEGREDVAEGIVRRHTVLERQETAQKLQLHPAERRHLDPGIRPTDHSAQAHQQNLAQGIQRLRRLARVFQPRKVRQKANLIALIRHPSLHKRETPITLVDSPDSSDCPSM